uniref:Rab interacting lysosomal protein n=1 Tax=Chrysemys picta bellii TaxID=8478 RepID=A0A8C3I653_CHRPI
MAALPASGVWLLPKPARLPGGCSRHPVRVAWLAAVPGSRTAAAVWLQSRTAMGAVCPMCDPHWCPISKGVVDMAWHREGADLSGFALQDLEQKLSEAQRKEHVLQNRLAQLEEENQKLLAQLAESHSQEDSTLRKEREVMLRLKEVVDKQRDEIRAQAHEIVCKNHDTEALQEQLNRFMSMNEDLRHKLAVVQVQLKSSLEKKEDLETMVLENQREIDRLTRAASGASPRLNMDGAAAPVEELQHQDWGRNSAPSCFCKEELKQILQERNELKTSLFLVQEELAYYQRELLNDERIPSFLLEAMKSTIKKQRKKIRAKMLGTVEEPASSDEDESADCVDSQPRESKIKSFFGLWYHSSSKDPPNPGCSGVWEIIDSQDVHFEQEEENKPTHGSPDRVVPPP